jgi:predicted phosphodiesterase
MNIAILSDLHGQPVPTLREPVDLVLAAGDLDAGGPYGAIQVHERYDCPAICIAGNHEHYGWTIDIQHEAICNMSTHAFDDVRVLSCTLWTDFHLYGLAWTHEARDWANLAMNDYRRIRYWTPDKAQKQHFKELDWLTTELEKPWDGKTIVMTHHAPSPKSIHPKYKDDILNASFASDLEYLMPYVDLWVHGHVHSPFDYRVGDCRVVCNPCGYKGENPGPYEASIVTL